MFTRRLLVGFIRHQNVRYEGHSSSVYKAYLDLIGKREIVGYGFNGNPNYLDRADFPMPAIRFKEPTPEIEKLRIKEKGDWKNLTIEEKKALYRASFCQTFAEMTANDGEWKSVTGWTFFFLGCTLWMFTFIAWLTRDGKELPPSFSEEGRIAQYKRLIDMNVNPITGISSYKFREK